ncbi:MAG TPA: TonB-dependent receptor [Longimicrobiales bacterium]|nr:TonB-dependent receptor [Longimicrobiales bacterium]
MRVALLIAAMALALTAAWRPPTGTIAGTVRSAETGEPLSNVSVVVVGTGRGALTDAEGRFEIRGVPTGARTVEASRIGYGDVRASVTVVEGAAATVELTLTPTPVPIENLTVTTASRRTEKITEAPATIDVITSQQIADYPSSNVGELFARQKGLDYVRTGVLGTGFNVRGFNSAFNPKNLQMNDGRLSTLIATGLPWGPLSTTVKDDIERIEVVLGPTAALYGPNAHNGLVNVITKDPRRYPGTTLAVGGGNHSVLDARFRHAQVLSDKLAFKVAGEYNRGTEFDYVDTVYVGTAALNELDLDRDFDALRGEASLQYSATPSSDVILTYGGSKTNMLSPTNAGRNQIKDWMLNFLQGRFVSPRLFAQAYYTWSSTDSTYAINQRTQNYASFLAAGFSDAEARQRSFREAWTGTKAAGRALSRGALFQDASRRFNGEVQYNASLAGSHFTVGAQLQRDMANSNGTYLLDKNGTIDLDQYGVYGQAEAPFGSSGLKAVVAARGDHHELYGFNFIPKGGLVYTRGASTWRATYGKGIAAPTILNLSMNIFGGLALGNGEGFTLSNGTKIDPLKVETIQTFEGGYRGVLGDRFFADLDGYYNKSKNFISPLINIVPKGLSGGPTVTYRGSTPIADVGGGLVKPGDYVLANVNFGHVDTYGFDAGLSYYVRTGVSLVGNYSYFNFSLDQTDPKNDADANGKVEDTDLPINTPKHKASLGLNADMDRWFGSVFTRWVDKYDFFSGINVASRTHPGLIYNGSPVVEGARVGREFNEGPLGGFVDVDLSLGVRLTPWFSVAGAVTNAFDRKVREFVASPPIGRLFSLEAKVTRAGGFSATPASERAGGRGSRER